MEKSEKIPDRSRRKNERQGQIGKEYEGEDTRTREKMRWGEREREREKKRYNVKTK